jgi:predicted house-cleaning NTP pyrophosphatase (Maf/HAM1 superfamily)
MTGRLKLVLASGSPRRLALLNQIGVEPDRVMPASIDETPKRNELPRNLARRLAHEKLTAALATAKADPELAGALVLAADTVVSVGRRILPKAELIEEAAACLRHLSGRSHRVYTGLAFANAKGHVRRRLVETLLGAAVLLSLVQTALLVASLVSGSADELTGPQLLQSGATLWFANVVAFGLAFWTADAGGPVRRAMAPTRTHVDFSFPQDSAGIPGDGWAPHLVDYLYVSLTNSIAFSPTDTMPLSRRAKGMMAVGALVSAITVLLVAARAVNILG